MTRLSRPLLRLKSNELVPAEEDRRVEIGIYDVLLPCRKYDVSYKVAVLGKVSPSLEFLLRVVKAVPGISVESAAAFFGFSRKEMAYVIDEAIGPGFAEIREGRLWLTTAGDALFKDGEDEPSIYSVEERNRSVGFDLLAIAPQPPRPLDTIEQWLPELPIEDGAATGKVADKIFERFGRFFHELSDRKDREQFQRRDLYSIDKVVPKERFQVPLRIRAFAQASNPSLPEIDLSSWRPDYEVADRPQIENAAALLLGDLKVTVNQINAAAAYEVLTDLAPEFLKEFITRSGLSVNRYWREAVGRAGEPRSDRRTVPIVGPLCAEENTKRLRSILDYGMRDGETPKLAFSIAPQAPLWGASTQQRDALSLIRRAVGLKSIADAPEMKLVCLFSGQPPRYVQHTFDEVHCSESIEFPAALELFLIPDCTIVAIVHAPIGASSGHAVPLGFASFDKDVVARAQALVADRLGRFVQDDEQYAQYYRALASK